MQQLYINQFEKMASQDINNAQLAMGQSLSDDVLYPMLGSASGVLGSGFLPTYTSAYVGSLSVGVGFYYDSSQTGFNPKYRMIKASSAVALAFTTAHATLNRIDLVCLAPTFAVTSTASRYVKTGGTGPVALTTVNKVYSSGYTLSVVAGTPNASPAQPALPAGYIPIAAVLITAATGMTGQSAITDLRQILFPTVSLTVVAGETMNTVPTAVYLSAGGSDGSRTTGAAYRVDVGVTNGATRYGFSGFLVGATTSGNQGQVVARGLVQGFSGLTPGKLYYADPSSVGGVTATKPSTVNQWVVPVGIAITSSSLLVDAASSFALAVVVSAPVGVGVGAGGVLVVNHASSPYSITSSNQGQMFLVDTTGGSVQMNLPDPTLNQNLKFTIKDYKQNFDTTPCTLHRFGSEQLEGVASDYSHEAPGGEWTWIGDATNWDICGR